MSNLLQADLLVTNASRTALLLNATDTVFNSHGLLKWLLLRTSLRQGVQMDHVVWCLPWVSLDPILEFEVPQDSNV